MKKPFKYLFFLKDYPEDNPKWFGGCKYQVQSEDFDNYIVTYSSPDFNNLSHKPISKSLESIFYKSENIYCKDCDRT